MPHSVLLGIVLVTYEERLSIGRLMLVISVTWNKGHCTEFLMEMQSECRMKPRQSCIGSVKESCVGACVLPVLLFYSCLPRCVIEANDVCCPMEVL